MEDRKAKLIVVLITGGIFSLIILAMIARPIINKFKKSNIEQAPEQTSEQAEGDIYGIEPVLRTITDDETPFSLGLICSGTINYTGGAELSYKIDMQNKTEIQNADPTWLRLTTKTNTSIGLQLDTGDTREDTAESTAYIRLLPDKITEYYEDEDLWFYVENALAETTETIPDLKPLTEYLNAKAKKENNEIVCRFNTRDEEFVYAVNAIGNREIADMLFPRILSYQTDITLCIGLVDGKFNSYRIETMDKSIAYSVFQEMAGYQDVNGIPSDGSFIISMQMPQSEDFEIPDKVLNAMSEEEWLAIVNQETEEEIPEEPASEPEKELNSESDSKPPTEETPVHKIDITDKDSVFHYLTDFFSKSHQEEAQDKLEDAPLTEEEIQEIYGDILKKTFGEE